MKIEFNTVTWYSKLAAVIFFIGVLPVLSFYIGKQYGEVISLSQTPIYTAPNPKVIEFKTVSTTESENIKYFKPSSSITNVSGTYSNIVGYFGSGSFYFYVPQWIPDHWKMEKLANGGMTFALKETVEYKDFSDITIDIVATTEKMNAETLYSQTAATDDKATCISGSRCEVREAGSAIVTSEILLSRVGDTRIYHIAQKMLDNTIRDKFYIDGKKSTAVITFSADKDVYAQYETIIRDFVQGIGSGEAPQG